MGRSDRVRLKVVGAEHRDEHRRHAQIETREVNLIDLRPELVKNRFGLIVGDQAVFDRQAVERWRCVVMQRAVLALPPRQPAGFRVEQRLEIGGFQAIRAIRKVSALLGAAELGFHIRDAAELRDK